MADRSGARAMLRRAGAAASPSHHGVVTWLGVLVLTPMAAVVVLTWADAQASWQTTREARHVADEATRLYDLVEGRAAVSGESMYSSSIAYAADLGVDRSELRTAYGIDFDARLVAARRRVDEVSPMLSADPELRAELQALDTLRAEVDASTASYPAVRAAFEGIYDDVDRLWDGAAGRLDEVIRAQEQSELIVMVDAVRRAHKTFRTTLGVLPQAAALITGDPTADIGGLAGDSARYDEALAHAQGRVGERAAAALAALTGDPAAVRFRRFVDLAVEATARGELLPEAGDRAAFAAAFLDGIHWAELAQAYSEASALDLRASALDGISEARTDLVYTAAAGGAILAITVAMGLLVARSLIRSVSRLAVAAGEIATGTFDLPDLPASGPRELVHTSGVVNDMAGTLHALETYAIQLSEDPRSPALDDPLPGRTGAALQVAVDDLRASIRAAEDQRAQLALVATYDGLTGLMRREAALDAVGRDLAYADRNHLQVVLAFVDLDDFKTINDSFGHDAGDAALRCVAESLRSGARAADVVGRIGGDEFVVAGIGSDADPSAMGERLRAAITARSCAIGDKVVPLRCSVGLATSLPGDDATTLLARADRAMYEAKAQGRRRSPSQRAEGGPAATR